MMDTAMMMSSQEKDTADTDTYHCVDIHVEGSTV